MTVRDAQAADAQAIARVHVDSWRTTYRGIIPRNYLDGLSYEIRANYWRNQLADHYNRLEQGPDWTVVVAEEMILQDDEEVPLVVGFAAGGEERDGNPAFTAELGAIYLFEAYQRRGIGRHLLGAIAARLAAQGHTNLLVWVLDQNPASAFYEALGARLVDRRTITLAGASLDELAYGWDDIRRLLDSLSGPSR